MCVVALAPAAPPRPVKLPLRTFVVIGVADLSPIFVHNSVDDLSETRVAMGNSAVCTKNEQPSFDHASCRYSSDKLPSGNLIASCRAGLVQRRHQFVVAFLVALVQIGCRR
jgi:hypothetical protein